MCYEPKCCQPSCRTTLPCLFFSDWVLHTDPIEDPSRHCPLLFLALSPAIHPHASQNLSILFGKVALLSLLPWALNWVLWRHIVSWPQGPPVRIHHLWSEDLPRYDRVTVSLCTPSASPNPAFTPLFLPCCALKTPSKGRQTAVSETRNAAYHHELNRNAWRLERNTRVLWAVRLLQVDSAVNSSAPIKPIIFVFARERGNHSDCFNKEEQVIV